MVTFSITTGILTAGDGSYIGDAYSGNGADLDNPEATADKGHGPIPVGLYSIGEPFDEVPGLGPFVMRLTPMPGNEMFDRGSFCCHGDNAKHDYTGSDGCIVAPPLERQEVWKEPDHLINVVA